MKKNKIVNLFENDKNILNTEVKYAELLEKFILPFTKEFESFEYQEDIFELAINAWNFGNMSSILDEDDFEDIISNAKDEDIDYDLLLKMIAHKNLEFEEFSDFIIDFNIKKNKKTFSINVVTEDEDTYMTNMFFQSSETAPMEDEFEENYINRSAITIKPLQPFIDWHNTLYPTSKIDASEFKDINIYLINNTSHKDIETHLKKKFDNYFMRELEDWHTDKKAWPQRRNYKMFKNWFEVNISTAVFDLENTPVSKSDY
ncbi:hypothetical protein [Polaribacter sargassicola]|uniref:hypothetical protein n=1 Tax=Polaribacter sargassicola TaxID=2836891 RepID=UPI001F1E0D46|nr:hypothetical protein [Polaribacter sp. DS7-9]MCG1036381.1 hypothetical protein [Polaribacter sp. DS7-9]